MYSLDNFPVNYSALLAIVITFYITSLTLKMEVRWKQPRCPFSEEWIKKLWYLYAMEYYSAIKRDIFESVLMRWMNLDIIQSEISQKDKYCILTHIYGI